jgi:hypothetical protein
VADHDYVRDLRVTVREVGTLDVAAPRPPGRAWRTPALRTRPIGWMASGAEDSERQARHEQQRW